MKLNVDKEADALYLRLDDSPIVESEEVFARRRARLQRIERSRRGGDAPSLQALVQPESLGLAVRDSLSVRAQRQARHVHDRRRDVLDADYLLTWNRSNGNTPPDHLDDPSDLA